MLWLYKNLIGDAKLLRLVVSMRAVKCTTGESEMCHERYTERRSRCTHCTSDPGLFHMLLESRIPAGRKAERVDLWTAYSANCSVHSASHGTQAVHYAFVSEAMPPGEPRDHVPSS
jgi:hypothetical protein